MHKIEAIIKRERLGGVLEALKGSKLNGLTVQEVHGFGRQKGYKEHYRGLQIEVNLLPKVKLEIVLEDERVEEIVETIVQAARSGESGEIGDGKIFVIPVAQAIRIRTRERGFAALEGFETVEAGSEISAH